EDRADGVNEDAFGSENFYAPESRQVGGDWVDEVDAPFFQKRHEGRADDRLGHGIEAEDRVRGHRRLGFLVPPAEAFGVHDLAASRDQRADAGINSAVDVCLHAAPDPFQAIRIHSDAFGGLDSHSLPPSTVRSAMIDRATIAIKPESSDRRALHPRGRSTRSIWISSGLRGGASGVREKPAGRGLECLGIPWIPSSESGLFKWLRGGPGRKNLAGPPPRLGAPPPRDRVRPVRSSARGPRRPARGSRP